MLSGWSAKAVLLNPHICADERLSNVCRRSGTRLQMICRAVPYEMPHCVPAITELHGTRADEHCRNCTPAESELLPLEMWAATSTARVQTVCAHTNTHIPSTTHRLLEHKNIQRAKNHKNSTALNFIETKTKSEKNAPPHQCTRTSPRLINYHLHTWSEPHRRTTGTGRGAKLHVAHKLKVLTGELQAALLVSSGC